MRPSVTEEPGRTTEKNGVPGPPQITKAGEGSHARPHGRADPLEEASRAGWQEGVEPLQPAASQRSQPATDALGATCSSQAGGIDRSRQSSRVQGSLDRIERRVLIGAQIVG